MNNSTMFSAFLIGSVIGSAVTWYFLKKKYEKIAKEEIESVKAVFSMKKNSSDDKNFISLDGNEVWETDSKNNESTNREKPSIAEYAKKLSQEGYVNYDSMADEEKKNDSQKNIIDIQIGNSESVPFVISPDEFGEIESYGRITLTYYSDHILVDENDEMIEDVEGCVGFDSLNHFGEYEDDSVHVQNDRLKTYYEILMDNRQYTDVLKSKPYLMEDE